MPQINFTDDRDADALLSEDPLALLIGMLLDQQFPMERAFAGPALLRERVGHLDAARIAATDPDELAAAFKGPPAIHRYPGSMAGRVQQLCTVVAEEYDGDAAAVWTTAEDAAQLKRRLKALPGFGDQKVRIFTAVLAKRLGVAPDGWEAVAGDYALDGHRSIADVAVFADVEKVRAHKKAVKASRG